jgi:hypothetical protein
MAATAGFGFSVGEIRGGSAPDETVHKPASAGKARSTGSQDSNHITAIQQSRRAARTGRRPSDSAGPTHKRDGRASEQQKGGCPPNEADRSD